MGSALKFVSWASILAGPLAAIRIPAMAPDLRPWAEWVSGITAAGACALANVRLDNARARIQARKDLSLAVAAAFAFAVIYVFINLAWTTETGAFIDVIVETAIVVVYSLGFGS